MGSLKCLMILEYISNDEISFPIKKRKEIACIFRKSDFSLYQVPNKALIWSCSYEW